MTPPRLAINSFPRIHSSPLSMTIKVSLKGYPFSVKQMVALPLTTTSCPLAERSSTCGGLATNSTAASSGSSCSTWVEITLLPEPVSAMVDSQRAPPTR